MRSGLASICDANPDSVARSCAGLNEYLQFYELGVDGVFSDVPDHAVTARELFWEDWFRED